MGDWKRAVSRPPVQDAWKLDEVATRVERLLDTRWLGRRPNHRIFTSPVTLRRQRASWKPGREGVWRIYPEDKSSTDERSRRCLLALTP